MMQLNPFLTSIAAPAAAKTVQVVVQVAQGAGQSFLKTLGQLREVTAEVPRSAAQPTSVGGQLQQLAKGLRSWLKSHGITTPFELQFSLANNGDPIANVVGQQSEQIVDMLYANDLWLERLSHLAEQAPADKLAISTDDAYVIQSAPFAF